MKYIGNYSESEAEKCASHSKQYTHSEQHGGREVRYYDCWQIETAEGVNRLEKNGQPNK